MTKKQKVTYTLTALIAVFILIFSLLVGGGFGVAYAATPANTKQYSNVLDDLQKDGNFNKENFIQNPSDYSLQVIQISESSEKELFVYVFQPAFSAKKLEAKAINISTAINDSLYYQVYDLELLSYADGFSKYRVLDFVVKADALRYYSISNIFRPYDSGIDDEDTTDNNTLLVGCAVGQLWTAVTVDNKVSYHMEYEEVITITSQWGGSIRYSNGFSLLPTSCDSWFVAFSTDRDIDKLLEAEVYYVTQKWSCVTGMGVGTIYEYGDEVENYVNLKYDDEVSTPADGWFAKHYTWNRIVSVEDFKNDPDVKLTDEGKANLEGKEWVLRFAESTYGVNSFSNSGYGTYMRRVSILRLKFMTDGKIYNLGVVDNIYSVDNVPDNTNTNEFDFTVLTDWGKIIGAILGVIVFILICIFLLPIISPVLGTVFKVVWGAITLPFKTIAKLFKKKE